ncbi:MAG TPA: response regulator [Bryobacteraceae bacterium]|nr:response regulator [Bryobacteraceae bacterium]
MKNNMTNAAVLDILNYLCNDARNSVHASFGALEFLPHAAMDPTWQTYLDISRSSADRLLGSIDDFRELFSEASPASDTVEEFDLGMCLGEITELLNLASQKPACRVVLKACAQPWLVRQHRKSVEQLLTRILDSALKLTSAGDILVSMGAPSSDSEIRISVTPPESTLAARLADWLNADPQQVRFQDLPDMPHPLALMVAGKGLRNLGGSAQISSEPGVPTHLATFLPSLSSQDRERPQRESRPGLNILLTEDCDDSFALSELFLRKESVWRARNAPEAIEMVKKQRFDIVLMDIHMGGMDGYGAINAIRDWETETGNARTPIVILSSDDLETQRQSAARSGCTGFLRKPLRNNDLPDLLDRLRGVHSLCDQ